MNPEKNFNPSNPEYKEVKDLPQEEQANFVDVEGGFVRKEAKETLEDAGKIAEIANVLRETGLTGKDILNNRSYEEILRREGYGDALYDREQVDELISDARKMFGRQFEYVKDPQSNRMVVLEMVKKDGHALRNASFDLRSDKVVVLEAVKNCGLALLYVSGGLEDDKEVVLAAVKQDPDALIFAGARITNEIEDLLGLEAEREMRESDHYYERD